LTHNLTRCLGFLALRRGRKHVPLLRAPAVRTIELELGRFGLDPAKQYRVTGAPSRRSDDRYTIDAAIPSHGHVLVEVA